MPHDSMPKLNTDLQHWEQAAEKANYCASRLSREFHISRRQLERYTLKLFGRSPQRWLNGQRINKSPQILKNELLVKTAAFELGFKQASHFSREFKLRYGMSPRAFLRYGNSISQ
jgi:AraC-like DNA-binding protein